MFFRISAQSGLFAAFCCAFPATAQIAATPPATSLAFPENAVALDELIARALQNNPQPQIADANIEAARARVDSVRAQLGLTLQIVPGVGGNAQSRDEEILLSQPIDLFGARRANRAVFDAQLRGAQAQRDAATRALIISVKSAAAQLFTAQEAQSLGETQLEIATQFRDAAARRAELGEVPAVQTQRAQLELDRAAIELDSARAQRAIRRAQLNQLIGAAPESPLVVALPFSLPDAPDNSAMGFNPQKIRANDSAMGADSQKIGANLPEIVPNAAGTQTDVVAAQTDVVPASSQVGADLITARAALLPGALAAARRSVGSGER